MKKINDSLFNELKDMTKYIVIDSVSSVFDKPPCLEEKQVIESLSIQIMKEIDDQVLLDLANFDYSKYKKPYTFKKRKPNNLVSYINQIDREEK